MDQNNWIIWATKTLQSRYIFQGPQPSTEVETGLGSGVMVILTLSTLSSQKAGGSSWDSWGGWWRWWWERREDELGRGWPLYGRVRKVRGTTWSPRQRSGRCPCPCWWQWKSFYSGSRGRCPPEGWRWAPGGTPRPVWWAAACRPPAGGQRWGRHRPRHRHSEPGITITVSVLSSHDIHGVWVCMYISIS